MVSESSIMKAWSRGMLPWRDVNSFVRGFMIGWWADDEEADITQVS